MMHRRPVAHATDEYHRPTVVVLRQEFLCAQLTAAVNVAVLNNSWCATRQNQRSHNNADNKRLLSARTRTPCSIRALLRRVENSAAAVLYQPRWLTLACSTTTPA